MDDKVEKVRIKTESEYVGEIVAEGVLIPLIIAGILSGLAYKFIGVDSVTLGAFVSGVVISLFIPDVRRALGKILEYVFGLLIVFGAIALIIWLFQ